MQLISSHICLTKGLGVHSNMFGGVLLSYLDQAGGVLAAQACETPRMVTVKMDEVEFLLPVRSGNIIKIYGEVTAFGNTSVTLRLEARKESAYTREQKLVCSTNIKFVRIDEDGEPVPISERARIEKTIPVTTKDRLVEIQEWRNSLK